MNRPGNINEGNIDSFFNNNDIRKKQARLELERIEPCLFCEWYKVCFGGCPANYVSKNEPNYYCEDYKRIFRHIKNKLENFSIIDSDGTHLDNLQKIPNQMLKEQLSNIITGKVFEKYDGER